MRTLFASLLFATACSSSAYADQIAVPQPLGPRIALAVAPDKTRAPYDVQVITDDGDTAPTYAFKDRFYVQGSDNSHYSIRVTNPTPQRVEAVVSVDGLDVVDGEAGDLRKRGYIVPAYGEVRIEGFRTSLADVASFRFTSVDNSYAGRKGKARNVGVIAVAIFEEQNQPGVEIVAPQPQVGGVYHWEDDVDADARPTPNRGGYRDRGGMAKKDARKSAPAEGKAATRVSAADKEEVQAAPPPAQPGSASGYGGGRGAVAKSMPRPPMDDDDGDFDGRDEWQPPVTEQAPQHTNRPGLGTEFGESRYSAASYTKFVRAAGRPIAIAELRYNDAAGLMALGIPVAPMPDEGEIMMRETADPFPGDNFAHAPR